MSISTNLTVFLRAIILLSVMVFFSGCGLFLMAALPEPSHTETIDINPDMSNPDLADHVLTILRKNRLIQCNSIPRLNNSDDKNPVCSVRLWQATPVRVDRIAGVITVGRYSYNSNTVGHKARFKRVDKDRLEITVKGADAYYLKIPNEAVAKHLATLLQQ